MRPPFSVKQYHDGKRGRCPESARSRDAGDGPALGSALVPRCLSALLRADLQLEVLEEHPFTNGCRIYERMRPLPGSRFEVPEGTPRLPLMFGLAARKPR